MSPLDIVLLALGCWFVVRGLFKGFSGEFFSLVSVVGGFYCATRFYTPLAAMLRDATGLSQFVSSAVAMGAIFLVIFIVCAAGQRVARGLIKATRLSWLDKIFGAAAGFLKVYVISLLTLVVGMVASPVTGDAWVRDSIALTAAAKTWPYVGPVFQDLGILPDLAQLQENARAYILKQASRSIFGANGGTEPEMAAPVDETAQSADVAPKAEQKNSMLDFFLSW